MTKRTPKQTVTTSGRGLDEFSKRYDANARADAGIRDALKSLGDAWEYENEFCRRAKICTRELTDRRDKLAGFFVTTRGRNPRRIWCGTKKFATQLRARINQV